MARRYRSRSIRKKVGKSTFLNLSRKGVSVTKKVGPVSVNSRGRVSLNLGGLGKLFKF